MPSKQLTIPGLEAPVKPSNKPAAGAKKRKDGLEYRIRTLELEVELLSIRMEKGDKDRA